MSGRSVVDDAILLYGDAMIDVPRTDVGPINRIAPSEFLTIRGLRYHVRRWGDPTARPLVLLHGTRDCAATFQFMVERLAHSWNIFAPDWRGHGLSDRAHGSYWIHDFIADLDALLETVFAGQPVDVIAHSMGGNVASLYFSVRTERVRRLIALDAADPRAWQLPVDPNGLLDEWLGIVRAARVPSGYASLEEAAERLRKANRRLTPERSDYLAKFSTGLGKDGRYRWLFDPAVQRSLPTLHTLDEWKGVWAHLKAPVLWVGSSDPRDDSPAFDEETIALLRTFLPHAEFVRLEDTGHNVQHDRPADVASLAEAFLLRGV